MSTFGSFIYRQSTMTDCKNAAALADFMYWTQTDSVALEIATRYPRFSSSSILVFVRRR
jgi:predicted secreted protein